MGIKISELQEKTTANDTDVIPVVDEGTKKITKANFLKEINEKIAGITLYDNEAGTNTSPMDLTESSANFKYIDIQYKLISSNTTYYSSTRIYEPNQKEVALNIYTAYSGGSDSIVGTLLIAFNEATATMRRNYTFVGASKGEKEMFITKIVGYK